MELERLATVAREHVVEALLLVDARAQARRDALVVRREVVGHREVEGAVAAAEDAEEAEGVVVVVAEGVVVK